MNTRFQNLSIAFFLFVFMAVPCFSQGLLQDTSGTNLFDKFQDEQFVEKSDSEVMQEEFKKKRAAYESLLTRETPIYFQAENQEIDEKNRIFTLSGNVEIWKDMFKLRADWVRIYQWSGKVESRGNVILEFGEDILTGETAEYNFNTGTGWLTNARASVEPQLFLEAETLVKLPDLESNGQGQYALYNGMVTACSGEHPAWRFDTNYAVIRLENYAHMNNVSAWIRKMPIFWTPYFFYPTKTDRATGLLTPSLKWSSSRGMIISEEFFLCINDYMDATVGLTYHSIIGLKEEVQFRNAFSQFSKGELNFEHIKEDESPSDNRDPEERWKLTYEQNAVLPLEIRATANLNYQSDETFDDDYGAVDQGINRYMDSRISLTRYWGTSSLSLDASYEKDLNVAQDARLEHLPRLEYYTGYKDLVGDFRWLMRVKGERIFRSGNVTASGENDDGEWSEVRRIEEDGLRGQFYAEFWYEFDEIPWMNIKPWISFDERVWDNARRYDSDYPGGTWATYDTIPESPENDWKAGLYESGDGYHRHICSTGIDLIGPKFYRIFDMLGYKRLTRMKHLIEPKVSVEYTPELLGQEAIMGYDFEDVINPGTKVTYSLTSRFLMKLKNKKSKKEKSGKKNQSAETSENAENELASEDEMTDDSTGLGSLESDSSEDNDTDHVDESDLAADRDGIVREFGYITLSQTYDLYKKDKWDERVVADGEDESIYYPFENIKLELTLNPFSHIYLSGRIEFDPWHEELSNGYIYGHIKKKDYRFGLRWDFTKNFLDDYYDNHALAIEGGKQLSDKWSFNSWIKFDFSKEYAPYAYLDLTYMSQCWGVTLHTFYKNNKEFNYLTGEGEDDEEIKFGLSFHLKNIDSIDTDSFGRFWWGDDR